MSDRLSKSIVVDGKEVWLVSYDGTTWAMDAYAHRIRNQRANQLHKAREAAQQAKLSEYKETKAAEQRKGVKTQTGILPLPIHNVWVHQEPLIGRDKGRKRGKANPKDGREVKRIHPVHFHRCPDRGHILHEEQGRKFSCCCDEPWKKRFCGGEACLHTVEPEWPVSQPIIEEREEPRRVISVRRYMKGVL